MSKAVTTNVFDDFIGNQHVVTFLQLNLARETTAHAYLLTGPRHVGKRFLAEQFANTLLCENNNVSACNACSSCQQVKRGVHADIVRLELDRTEGKRAISIEQVRQLQNALRLSSQTGKKIALIDDADTLSAEAANALLKTLEEPPRGGVLVLIAHQLDAVPETIVSRCQVLSFRPVQQSLLAERLQQKGASDEQAGYMSMAAFGRPGVALSLMQASAFTDQQQAVSEVLHLFNGSLLQRFTTLGAQLKQIDASGAAALLRRWTSVMRDVLLTKTGNANLVSTPALQSELNDVAQRYTVVQIQQVLERIGLASRYVAANVNPRLAIEHIILDF